jgi:lipopolysaccharide biosynthesis glycosyltransferase
MKTTTPTLPVRVFIGYDRRVPVIFHVMAHSIASRSSVPVALTPLVLPHFDGLLNREINENQSTEFSFSRFLVPYLSGYEGWSLFTDNDMIFLDDIANLWKLRDDRYAVQVVKHHHEPGESTKFLGERQTSYEKKNWSSVILFNNAKCRALTPEYVSTATGLQLHQFKWLDGDHEIGEIPHRWNYLVDYDPEVPADEVSNLHYTSGGPYFAETRNCGYAEEWLAERESMLAVNAKKLK